MNLNPIAMYKQIKALITIKSEANKLMDIIKTEAKPGWKTSEFWLGLIGIGSSIAVAASPLIPAATAPWLLSATTVITLGYTLARVIAKATPSPKDDEFLDALVGKLKPVIDLDKPKAP